MEVSNLRQILSQVKFQIKGGYFMAAKGLKSLLDDEVVRFQRFSVTESGAATFTQAAFDTQLSIERGVIWLIHCIEWLIFPDNLDDVAAGSFENVMCQITRESKSDIVYLNDSDLISFYAQSIGRSAAIGTDAGPLWWYDNDLPKVQKFALPIPYAAQNIYVAIKSTNASPQTIRGRIHYTIKEVSDAYFYRVAQALIG